MIGTTLGHLRHHLESLSTATGTYYVVCGRTGEQPVPAAGLSFESRPAARAAVRATEQYRAALRQYDPEVPVTDPIEGALSRLCSVSLLAGYDYHPRSEPRSRGCRSWELELGEYALGRGGETLVTLPIALELFRQDPARPIRLSDAVRAPSHSDSSWRVAVTTGTAECQRGLATLPAGERS
jgi:hypothetical protein